MGAMARTLNLATHMVRRDAFVEAAQRLMQARGFEQVTIQDLLDELGASRGAFYHYFDSKQSLLEAVVERMVEAGLGAVAPVVDGPDLGAIPKLQGVFTGIGRWKTEQKALVLALLQVWMSDDNAIVREKLRHGLSGRLAPLLSRIIVQGEREGVFRAGPPDEAARILVALLVGFQDVAMDLFIRRQSHLIGYDEVISTLDGFTRAFERILGAPAGSIQMTDESVLREWFG
jgi:AcrR family transcriptional regulator